ncbi:GAF domain-containing protein [Methanothermobacter sp.]|uniref:GAF domain-containing protein n=1 Tax=Methanothermobacter sp. TaxID=1884223 RepID=UPI002610797C|nr:GAF domain-containing protein [Methanothermobacter sp.]MDI9614671.1 GAF domain-containing protein [Methanothermobacter sp.]
MTARVLLVEDEAITAMDLQRKLEFQGYDVTGIAHSGEAAVELAEKLRPDLILMDIILRGPMSGVEAAERIKDLDIPVVFLSAHSEESTMESAREVQPYGYLIKPFDEKELFFTIELAIQRHRSERKIRKLNRSLRMLSDCNQAIVRINDTEELLMEICRIMVDVGGYRMAWIGFKEDDEFRSVRPVAEYGFHEGYLDSIRVSWGEGRYSEGPTGRSIKEGKPVIIRDTENDPSFAPWRDEAIGRGYMSVMGLPIRVMDENIGALTVYSSEKDSFDPEEVELLAELAADISFRLESESVLGEMEKRICELERNEELLREIFESTPLAILNFRVGDGIHLAELNRAASILTGLETAGGESIEDVLSGLHEDDLKEIIRAAERGDDSRWELLQYRNGDSVKFLELRTVKTSGDTVTVFLIDRSPAEN